jgi:DNA-binding MarR family transcriptional regulator
MSLSTVALALLGNKTTHSMTPRQLGVLGIVCAAAEPQTVRGLAARIGCARPAITRAVDELSASTLVARKPDPDDRRSVLISGTKAGMRLVAEIEKKLAA